MLTSQLSVLSNLMLGNPLPHTKKLINHLTVVLDWDDTLNDTYVEMREQLRAKGGPEVPDGDYLTLANTDGILQEILDEADFMRVYHAREGEHMLNKLIAQMQQCGVRFVICTHRGFHPNAEEKSEDAFNAIEWTPDEVILLDPAVNGDKVEYLSKHFPEGFVLVDDRPRWDDQSALPDNVYLMDQPWNQAIVPATPEHRVTGLYRLAEILKSVYDDWMAEYAKHDPRMSNGPVDSLIYAYLTGFLSKRIDDTYIRDLLAAQSPFPYTLQYISHVHNAPDWQGKIPKSPDFAFTDKEFLGVIGKWLAGLPIVPVLATNQSEWASGQVPGTYYATRDRDLLRVIEPGGFAYLRRVTVLYPGEFFTTWIERNESKYNVVEPNENGYLVAPVVPMVEYEIDGQRHSAIVATVKLKEKRDALWCALYKDDTEHPVANQLLSTLWISDYVSHIREYFELEVADKTVVDILNSITFIDTWLDQRPELSWTTVALGNRQVFERQGETGKKLISIIEAVGSPKTTDRQPRTLKHFVNFSEGSYIVNTEVGLLKAAADWYDATHVGVRHPDQDITSLVDVPPFTGPAVAVFFDKVHHKCFCSLTPIASIAEAVKFSA